MLKKLGGELFASAQKLQFKEKQKFALRSLSLIFS
jgi:hypothetical protein